MEPDLAVWLQQVRLPLLSWRDALEDQDRVEVVARGRELLVEMFGAGPGPEGFEDRVAELILAVARTVVAWRGEGELASVVRAEAGRQLVAALQWFGVPDA